MNSRSTGTRGTDKLIRARRSVLLLLLALALFFSGSLGAHAASSRPPFAPGEKLVYILKWEFVPAGEAVLEVRPIATLNEKAAYHFVLSARSNSFVDVFYKVRDHIEAYADIELNHSLFYKKKQHEGSHHRDEIIAFDWRKNEAAYSNFGRKEKPIVLMPGTFDPLSAFYYTRKLELKPRTHIERPVTDGKKMVLGRANIIRREKITVQSVSYDTLLLEPEIKDLGGVFKKSRDAKIQIWVTDDDRRIPVRIKSKVVVGSFTGELVSVEGNP